MIDTMEKLQREGIQDLQADCDHEMLTPSRGVTRGRWGFHPCDYETFKKLKALHKEYWRAVRQRSAWFAWEAKQPQNRVRRPKIRNEQGQVTGHGDPVPWVEPELSKIFFIPCRRSKGRVRPEISHAILKHYQDARKPVPLREAVTGFSPSTLKFIDDYFKMLAPIPAEQV